MHKLVEKGTYSPEDNKLRLYVVDSEERFEEETYSRLKALKFSWAPIQRLFFAHWSVAREDLLIELAGSIEADEFTLVERAENKAERLMKLSDKRELESSALMDASDRILSTLGSGQPILVGHHSERKMRKLLEQQERNQDAAVEKASQAEYWNYRAQGVIHHADYKSNSGLRLRRIETLLTDLRTLQRRLNHAYEMIKLWTKLSQIEDLAVKEKKVTWFAGLRGKDGAFSVENAYSDLCNGKATVDEIVQRSLELFEFSLSSNSRKRKMVHLLNRLGYERYMLGPTSRFSGKLTATIIKTFARKHGTDSPECKRVEGNWTLSSSCPLPVQIGDGLELALSDEEWCDLMVGLGYEVPAPKPKAPSILNFKAESIRVQMWSSVRELRQLELTKEEYQRIYSDYKGCKLSECGSFRVKVCRDPNAKGYTGEWFCVLLKDSKKHAVPKSASVTVQAEEVA